MPIIAYKAGGKEYRHTHSVQPELLSAHIEKYGTPVLPVDPNNLNRAALEFEVFRLD